MLLRRRRRLRRRGKVGNDSFDIVRSRGQEIHGVDARLSCPLVLDPHDLCVPVSLVSTERRAGRWGAGQTLDVELEDLERFEDIVEEVLRVPVDDEDLPSAVDGLDARDGVEIACKSGARSTSRSSVALQLVCVSAK